MRARTAAAALVAYALGALALAGCGAAGALGVEPETRPGAGDPPLRALAARHGVRIGAAADAGLRLAGADGERFRALLAREFDMLVAENTMKHARLQSAAGAWDFGAADSLVAFAAGHGMRLRGHTLVWHRQVAPWLQASGLTDAEVRRFLEQHIDTVVTRYRGRIDAWDVVNEALEEDGRLRESLWLRRLGPDYVETAFRRAHAADPAARLFYNDYNIEGINAKSDSALALLRRLRARGVPVHGVGLQAHFVAGQVPPTLARNIARFAELGLEVQITELDVRVPTPATEAALAQQARDYATVLDACVRTRGCTAVVVWGVSDRWSWIPREFPGFGDALPFDAALRPKPAYRALHERLALPAAPPVVP